jgi:predicted RND superfamily exporter protein
MDKMQSLTNSIIKFRWLIALLIPALTFTIIAIGGKNLGFEGNVRIWFGEESPIIKKYDWFKENFGNDERLIITFKDEKGIFNKKALASIERITEFLWETDNIARADSLSNYQYVHADPQYPDDILVDNFLEDIDAYTPEQLKAKELIATTDAQTKNRFISEDGKTTMIVARLIQQEKESEAVYFKLRDTIVPMLAAEQEKTGYKMYTNGNPIITIAFIETAQHDGMTFTPMIFLAILLLLWIIFKKFSGAILPILVVAFTAMIVMGLQGVLGFKLNNFTANIPIFVAAIGVADAVHIYWVWLLARRHGKSNAEAIYTTVDKNFLPAFLTSATTFVGFASLIPSEVIPIQTLGLATATAAIFAFVLSIIFVPAMLAIINPKVDAHESFSFDSDEKKMPQWAHKYSDFITNNHKKILLLSLAFVLFFVAGFSKVNVDTDAIKMFTEDMEIRKSTAFIQENVSGPANFELIIDTKEEGGIKDPKFLSTVDAFYKAYYAQHNTVHHLFSILDIVKRFNVVLHGNDDAFDIVPESKEMVAQFLLLYSLSLPQGMELNDQMDIGEQYMKLSIQRDMTSSHVSLAELEWVENWWKSTPYGAHVNGQMAMYTYMQENVTDTLFQSITLAIILVTMILLIAFRSFKAMLISLPPNLFPIILVVGLMGWLEIDINMGMAIAGVIIIGVAIDATIHFLVKYNYARNKGHDVHHSLAYMITFSGAAIVFSTIILSLSFSINAFSSFIPNIHFGVITASALIVALITDLFMLPALFAFFDKDKKK